MGARRRRGDFITFASVELLRKLPTAKRWETLKAMAGQGSMATRELDAGLLDRTEAGQVVFPYDAVRVDFTLQAA